MEFKRAEYVLFDRSIKEVSRKLIDVFNEMGKQFYENLEFKDSKDDLIYRCYFTYGLTIVERNAIYVGYHLDEKDNSDRILAVYIDYKNIESMINIVGIESLYEPVKCYFGEFNIRKTEEECNNTLFRVFDENTIDISFTSESVKKIFENTGDKIVKFCIVIGGDPEKDKNKFKENLKTKKPEKIY